MRQIKYIAFYCAVAFVFFSCTDEDTGVTDVDINQYAAESYLLSQAVYDDFFRVTAQVINNRSLNQQGTAIIDSAIVSRTNEGLTVDYGPEFQKGMDGRKRRGKYKMSFYGGSFTQVGGGVQIQLSDFYIAGNKRVYGTINILCDSIPQANLLAYSFQVSNGLIVYQMDYEYEIGYSTDYTVLWKNLISTPDMLEDDTLFLIGKAEGRSYQFDRYFIDVLDTLIKPFACRWIDVGEVFMNMPDLDIDEVYLNYGDRNDTTSHCNNRVSFNAVGVNASGEVLEAGGKMAIPF